MKLDHPVVDRLGRSLVARGAELDQYMIDSMIKMGIMTVYVQEGTEDEEAKPDVPVCAEAERNIERRSDLSRFALENAIIRISLLLRPVLWIPLAQSSSGMFVRERL